MSITGGQDAALARVTYVHAGLPAMYPSAPLLRIVHRPS